MPTGTPTVVAAVAAHPSSINNPVAERRLVSVLFADLVGFTAISADRDPEETRELLSRYFDLSRDVIARYGGTVEKFIGDAVMAVWGAPTAHEDDAERAVRAGLDLVDLVRSLGPTIQARAGVLTGEAAVTIGAVGQGMIAGDLVNTASRLQSAALPGTVLVGEATQRAASKAIAFEPAGEQTLKGKTSPVPAWRALRVVAQVGGRNRSETLEAPFVGRDDELRLLKDLFHATSREGRARLVSVIGPAGIGKSRLAWEFLKYLDGLVESVWFHDGRSPAYGEGISFWALGEMVRRRAGLIETDDEPTTRAKITATVAEHIPDEDERRWIEPALLALLGFESGIGSDELFGAWRTFFERLAASAPVVLIFEDFHFADSGLLDFVDHVMEWSRNVPIYIVTLARPELLEKRPTWGAGKRNFHSIYLEPLSGAAMHELLTGLVPGLPEAAVRAIVARADGIPLYAVETVRMLVAEGRLTLANGVYRPVGDLTTLAVPETLTALIASRLDGLDPDDRALVSDAAVLGQSFTLAGLAAVSGSDAANLEPRLRTLVRRELFTLEADPRSPERGQYAFVQALIREVAYNTLARADRKVRHLAAARFFEGLGTDELAGALAGHYLAAHANAPEGPAADALAGQARLALRAAAERAAALGAHDQAVAFVDQALTVTADPADRAELLERAGTSASVAGRHAVAESYLRRAIEIDRERSDREGTAQATANLARILINARRADVAQELLEAARTEFADLAPHPAGAALGGQLARAYYLNADRRRAIETADSVLETAEHLDLVAIVADTLVTRGSALCHLGRLTEGLALLRAGQELAERNGLSDTLIRAIGNRALYEAAQDPRSALEIARAGLLIAHRIGHRNPVILGNAVYAAIRLGEWTWASGAVAEALAQDLEPSDRAEVLVLSVWLNAFIGAPTGELIAEVERLVAGVTDIYRLMAVPWARAAALFAEGHLRDARDEWRLAIDGFADPSSLPLPARAALWSGDRDAVRADLAAFDAAGVHGPPMEADRTTMRAGLAALEGRTTDALNLYRNALRAWRTLQLPWDEALCAIDMAAVLGPGQQDVRAAAETAREILVRLSARPFVARLDAAMAGRPAGVSSTNAPIVDAPTPA